MSARTMLSFTSGTKRFNFRVAAIALRDNHVLTCREDDDDYVMLPGGRVEFGETSAIAMRRELQEELRSPADIGPLLFSVENFFARAGEDFHEIGHYYTVNLPAAFPFAPGAVCLQTEDEGHLLSFEWMRAEPELLAAANLLPLWLQTRLQALPANTMHFAIDERENG